MHPCDFSLNFLFFWGGGGIKNNELLKTFSYLKVKKIKPAKYSY